MKAVIAGAGINGLCTAWALVRAGWQVEIAEAGPIPNPLAASSDNHRLIRTHYAGFPVYAARIAEAFAAWAELFADTGTDGYVERGILALSRAAGDWTDRGVAAMSEAGIPHQILDPVEIARRFPAFATDGVRFGAYTATGGALLADRILAGLAGWLSRSGAALHPGRPVTGLDAATGTALTPQGPLQRDVLILAAGIGLPALVPSVTDGFHPRRALVVYADPPPDLAAAWADAPCWVDLGHEDDLWGMPPIAGLPLKLGFGLNTTAGDPATGRQVVPQDTRNILGAYAGRLKGIDRFSHRLTVANFYLMAPAERFHLSRDRRAVVLSADSCHGFKFGALTGCDVVAALSGDFDAVARRLAGHT
jgi:glycine/D-amino acid oxidase-like deaminating enzyme